MHNKTENVILADFRNIMSSGRLTVCPDLSIQSFAFNAHGARLCGRKCVSLLHKLHPAVQVSLTVFSRTMINNL